MGEEEIFTYYPVLGDQSAVFMLGVDPPYLGSARYGVYEVQVASIPAPVPLSRLGVLALVLALAAVALRRV